MSRHLWGEFFACGLVCNLYSRRELCFFAVVCAVGTGHAGSPNHQKGFSQPARSHILERVSRKGSRGAARLHFGRG